MKEPIDPSTCEFAVHDLMQPGATATSSALITALHVAGHDARRQAKQLVECMMMTPGKINTRLPIPSDDERHDRDTTAAQSLATIPTLRDTVDTAHPGPGPWNRRTPNDWPIGISLPDIFSTTGHLERFCRLASRVGQLVGVPGLGSGGC